MAAGIQSADELVLTEMIFNGVFSPLSPQQAVALLSCFLWHEKSDVGIKVIPRCITLKLPTETVATAVSAHAHCASRAATDCLRCAWVLSRPEHRRKCHHVHASRS